MYGTIVNGVYEEAPETLTVEKVIKGKVKRFRAMMPSKEQYASAGYLPVEVDEYPSTGRDCELIYTERDGVIRGEWHELEGSNIGENNTSTLESRVTALEEKLLATEIMLGVNE